MSGESWRRVLENTGALEQSGHPDRMQRGSCRKEFNRSRSGDGERRVTGFDAGLNDRDRALVLWMFRLRVEMIVQRWRSAEDKREQERAERCESDSSAAVHAPDFLAIAE